MEVLQWLKNRRCECGDAVYLESKEKWATVSDIGMIASLFQEKPQLEREKPLITVYRLGAGRSLQEGPFTLSATTEMVRQGTLSPASWVFFEGELEWRQVKAVEILSQALPPLPREAPDFSTPKETAVPDATPSAVPGAMSEAAAPDPVPDIATPGAVPEAVAPDPVPDIAAPGTVPTEEALSIGVTSPPTPPAPLVTESLAQDQSLGDGVDYIPREEQTMAFSILGLSALKEEEGLDAPPAPPVSAQVAEASSAPLPASPEAAPSPAAPSPAAPTPAVPTAPTAMSTEMVNSGEKATEEDSDDMAIEISSDPTWYVKQESSGRLSGPFTFQEVVGMLQGGSLSKDDKIAKVGSDRFNKIEQQYEFNAKYSIETVVENGVERQKILIRRRHPRATYMTDAQISLNGQVFHAKCVNISAGGVLLETANLDVSLNDQLELTLMPGAITKQIQTTALVIGKIPKNPPGFALKFVNLSIEDKEAIQSYVMETLKRQQAMGM